MSWYNNYNSYFAGEQHTVWICKVTLIWVKQEKQEQVGKFNENNFL